LWPRIFVEQGCSVEKGKIDDQIPPSSTTEEQSDLGFVLNFFQFRPFTIRPMSFVGYGVIVRPIDDEAFSHIIFSIHLNLEEAGFSNRRKYSAQAITSLSPHLISFILLSSSKLTELCKYKQLLHLVSKRSSVPPILVLATINLPIQHRAPTIPVSNSHYGDKFNLLLSSITILPSSAITIRRANIPIFDAFVLHSSRDLCIA